MDEPTAPLAAQQLAVSFERGTNNLKLDGPGTVSVSPTAVILAYQAPRILGFALGHKYKEFPLQDIINVEMRDRIVTLRTRTGDTWVDLRLRSMDEATALYAQLPREMTPDFREQLAKEQRFHEHLDVVSARTPVTPALVALNVAMFLVMLFAGAGFLETDASVHMRFGSNFGPFTWTAEPWRLITSAFIHFGVIHLAFNMYALYRGGILTERLFGSARFALIYLLAAVSGSVVSGWWNPLRNSAGASGAIFGVYGALLVFFALRREDIPRSMLRSSGRGALTLCVYSLVLGATNPLIDNACHVGGLLGGALAAFFLVRPVDPAVRAQAQPGRLAAVTAGVCVALFALAAPLALPGGSRHAALQVDAVQFRFGWDEARIVDLQQKILGDRDAKRLTRVDAAARLEREVLEPWRQAMQGVLQIPAIEPADSVAAKRRGLLQAYVKARERAIELTIDELRDPKEGTMASMNAAWIQVSTLVKEVTSLPDEN